MANKHFSSREIALSAGLAALSATVQLVHIGYQSPTWGMWIDVVSVTWIIAYFLFDFQAALLVSLVGSIIITLFAPETWLGASMKFVATIPVIFALFVWARMGKKHPEVYRKPQNLVIPFLVGTLVRCALVLPLNYYYAIPIWTGMTTAAAMKAIPWFIIVLFNVVQTIVDIALAWVIVFRFKLDRFRTTTAM